MARIRRAAQGAALVVTCVLASCGAPQPAATRTLAVDPEMPRIFWEEMAPLCEGYPSKQECDDGDMALFGGLLCASGDERGCALVRDAQGTDGRWWRSPRRRDGQVRTGASFSRDMSLGVLLYLATAHDGDAAGRWLDWIDSHRPCVIKLPNGSCASHGLHRLCTDDDGNSCTITPAIWGAMGSVWRSLDLPLTTEMRAGLGLDDGALAVQARSAPIGYQAHLVAVQAFLKQTQGDATAGTRDAVATLADRQPDNPFFAYLAGDHSPALRARVHTLCPTRAGGIPDRRSQWAWERDTAGAPWQSSIGWDCIFLDNLLAAPFR
jgi:hypothetical protein